MPLLLCGEASSILLVCLVALVHSLLAPSGVWSLGLKCRRSRCSECRGALGDRVNGGSIHLTVISNEMILNKHAFFKPTHHCASFPHPPTVILRVTAAKTAVSSVWGPKPAGLGPHNDVCGSRHRQGQKRLAADRPSTVSQQRKLAAKGQSDSALGVLAAFREHCCS